MDNTIFITLIGIIITLYFANHQKKIQHEELSKQLFTEFNIRYAKLNNALIEIESKYKDCEEFNGDMDSFPFKQQVNDYFSLCAEEFYWYYHKKRIDPIIWESWHTGMNYWYRIPIIKILWKIEIENNGKKAYYITDKKEFFVEQ